MSWIKAHFDGTAVILDEPALLAIGQQVRVVADPPPSPPSGPANPSRPTLVGFAKGTFEVRDDFDEPLDEFAEYR